MADLEETLAKQLQSLQAPEEKENNAPPSSPQPLEHTSAVLPHFPCLQRAPSASGILPGGQCLSLSPDMLQLSKGISSPLELKEMDPISCHPRICKAPPIAPGKPSALRVPSSGADASNQLTEIRVFQSSPGPSLSSSLFGALCLTVLSLQK